MSEQTGQTGASGRTDRDDDDPALRPLDPRPLRDIEHGRTGAMWSAMVLMLVGIFIAGIGMVVNFFVPLLIAGAALVVLGIIVGLVLRAVGYGLHQQT